MMPNRSALFLEEMGVGPLWRLRHGAAEAEALPEVADVTDVAEMVAEPAPEVIVAKAEPIAAAIVLPVAAPVPPPVVAAAKPATADASTAWFDDAPTPPPLAPVSAEEIAAMDWNALKTAAARCTRCELGRTRKSSVFGRGEQRATWMVLGSGPNRADEKEIRPVSGDAGKLLANMLLAIGLKADAEVYVTNLVKCRPVDTSGAERLPTADEASACRPYLERELALTGARTMLTLGQAAATGLALDEAAARGKVRQLGAVAVIATYHPDELMASPAAKARAWGDLCLARTTHAGPG